MNTTPTSYIVVPAPGCYGDVTRIISSHRTPEAAVKAAKKLGRAVARHASGKKGDRWYRVYEQTCPEVQS